MKDEIRSELEKIRSKYLGAAEEITSGFEREISLSKDYEGRQIFELLQNADDEAADSEGKVLIAFDGKTLSVSNTGTPFSLKGIKSLIYPNASPKKVHANKIGCKGLGFRSILTWTDSVVIATEAFTVEFSKEIARDFLESILEEKPSLSSDIRSLTKEKYPIAILSCPKLLEEKRIVDGYSTSIILECHEKSSQEIETQIKSLEFEELVFLPNLKEVEIICGEYHKTFCKVVDGDEVAIEVKDVNTGESDFVTWKLYRKNGLIYDENGREKDYEFIIAYDHSGLRRGTVLYSYFKTDVQLGFPALIHGTFELTSDRNNLQKQSEVNKQLIPLLADFMVETAVRISEERKECDYGPLSLIISSEIDYVLSNTYNFEELLKEKTLGKKILPTIRNEYISLDDHPFYSRNAFSEVLKPCLFSTLLKATDSSDIEEYITSDLGIRFYDCRAFCELIDSDLSSYNLEKRVKLIALCNKEFKQFPNGVFPHLLKDSNGNDICDGVKVYPVPIEEQVIDLPEWASIRFLNKEMEQMLQDVLNSGGVRRDLVNQLKRYNLEEYSFDKILRSVVEKENPTLDTEKCKDIIKWLWRFFDSIDSSKKIESRVKIICRNGKIEYADTSYMGADFGNELGERIVGLYSDKFVDLANLGVESLDFDKLSRFLIWLGVSKYPRLISEKINDQEYESTCYPLRVERDNYSYTQKDAPYIKDVFVGTIENISKILTEANFNDILSWFLVDEKIKKRLSEETEIMNEFSKIVCKPFKKFDFRTVNNACMKSYLRFVLMKEKWILGKNGEKKESRYCCFEDVSLAPLIIIPSIDFEYIKKIVGRNCRKEIEAILNWLGVSDVFEEMESSAIYEALNALPRLDPDFKKAKSLYRKIIRGDRKPEELTANNPEFEKFINQGFVLSRKNGTRRYASIESVRYSDKKVFSDEILSNFEIFDIDARSGEEKVKKLFGVQPLKLENVEVIGEPKLHSLNEALKKEYLRFLPFVLACRMCSKGKNTTESDFRKLNTSKIIFCEDVTVKYRSSGNVIETILKDFKHVYLRSKNTAYICVPEHKYSSVRDLRQNFHFADLIAEILSAILDVNEDKEFFRDLFRDDDDIREAKMRSDKHDDNLELLSKARKLLKTKINLCDSFWMTIAEMLSLSGKNLSENIAEQVKTDLDLSQDIDSMIDFEKIDDLRNAEPIINIFKALDIDLDGFNSLSQQYIDLREYWTSLFNKKMKSYLNRYKAFIIDEVRNELARTDLYYQYVSEYEYPSLEIKNSVYIDIDALFESEYGISFSALGEYSDEAIEQIIENERSNSSIDEFDGLTNDDLKIESYLVFGDINKLLIQEAVDAKEEISEFNPREVISQKANVPNTGIKSVIIQADDIKEGVAITTSSKNSHSNVVYSEKVDRVRQEIGVIGEFYAYKELRGKYSSVKWVSGNAEKAGYISRGDDTCGYDIRYTDDKGVVHYVEVKTSRSQDIVFLISNNELEFGCRHPKNFELMYVILDKENAETYEILNLGNIFDFKEGESLENNNRFTITPDGYRVTARVYDDNVK